MTEWWAPPLAAGLVLTAIHCHLGQHVLARGVIFVDLALAQAAALGAMVALIYGHAPGSGIAYALSLGTALAVAVLLAVTRERRRGVPQEAVIGVIYAVTSAGAIVLLDAAQDPHAGEHVRGMLVGNLVFVTWPQVAGIAAIYAGIGALHWWAHRAFRAISEDSEAAAAAGVAVGRWDALFYATFAVVITSSVQVAGVLLVFSYLIVPAALGVLLAHSWLGRLAIGWAAGSIVTAVGVGMSYDRPTGPVIVCLFGAALAAGGALHWVRRAENRPRAAGTLAAGVATVAAVVLSLWGLARITPVRETDPHAGHDHGTVPAAQPPAPAPAPSPAPAGSSDAEVALDTTRPEEDRIAAAVRLVEGGDQRGIAVLEAIAQSPIPIFAEEARAALERLRR